MMSSVPQFIDVEDKIAGPLTWRQLLWMIGMGAVLLFLFNVVSFTIFLILAVPTVLLFCALAFYRPNNQPLIVYALSAVFFLFRPKVAVWERPVARPMVPKKIPEKAPDSATPRTKKVTREELANLAHILDQGV